MQIKITPDHKIRLQDLDRFVDFPAELGGDVVHGITIAMAEIGRRVSEPPRTEPSVMLEISLEEDDDEES